MIGRSVFVRLLISESLMHKNFYTTFVSDTADEKVSSWWNHLSIQKKYQKGQLQM
jgi:hypothetical protein